MKSIKGLKKIIDILSFTLIGLAVSLFLFLIVIYFFGDSFLSPNYSQTLKLTFRVFFNWKMFVVPLVFAIDIVLFIIAIFSLRKSSSLFIQADFYNKKVIKNLRKAGSIFIFIGISMCVITLYSESMLLFYQKKDDFESVLIILIHAFDVKYIFFITIGLFLLLFSKIFDNSRMLKQENDLTI